MRFRAVEVHFKHEGQRIGYEPHVYSNYVGAFVPIQVHPHFSTPEQAVRWARDVWWGGSENRGERNVER